MKLLLCKACGDIFNLRVIVKRCRCHKTRGAYYPDRLNAWYTGEHAIPLGIYNGSLDMALAERPQSGDGSRFTAFVIPLECATFKRST